MSKDLNQCNFIGRLGNDVELKYLPSGGAVANISIAVGDDYKDKNTGQKVEKTEWVRVTAFGRLAEICGSYLSKGSKVFISGKFTTRKWQDQSGADRYTTEIVASEMQMLDSRGEGGGHAQQPQQAPATHGGGGYQKSPNDEGGDAQSQPSAGAQRTAASHSSQPPPAGGFNDGFDDDIPF